MGIIKYLFMLGIINIVFSYVWKWVVVLPTAFLFTILKLGGLMHLVKAVGYYLLTSLTAVMTLYAIAEDPTMTNLILFTLIGGFVLFMGFSSSHYEAKKQASIEYDYELLRALRVDGFFAIGAMFLFVILLLFPSLAYSSLTLSLVDIVDWAYNFPVIGFLLGLGGIFFLIIRHL